MDTLSTYPGHVEHDPALLAFVKCHVSSFLRWDILRLLANSGDRWLEAADAAGLLHKPAQAVSTALEELRREGLLKRRRSPRGSYIYRMDPEEPSSKVVGRLVGAATRSQELRQIIIARLVNGARLAS